ncbi:MAG: hypothetical protein V1855_05305, partial [bacterium]
MNGVFMSKRTASFKTIMQILLIGTLAVFVGRVIYRVFWEEKSPVVQESREFAHLRIQEAAKETATLFPTQEGFSYNFQRMIQLIDACEKIKRETAFRFEGDLIVSKGSVERDSV